MTSDLSAITEPPAPSSGGTSTSRAIVKDSAWLVIDNVVAIVTAFAQSILVARILGQDKMGYFNYVAWAAQMVRPAADLGVTLAVRRFAAEYRGRGDLATITSIARVAERFQLTTGTLAVLAALGYVFTSVDPDHRWYSAVVMLAAGPSIVIGVPASVLWATDNLSTAIKGSVAAAILNLVLVIAALLFQLDLFGLACAMLAARTLDFVLRFVAYRRVVRGLPSGPAKLPAELKPRFIAFCRSQSILVAIELVLWNRFEVFFLERYCAINQVAFYSLSFGLVQYVLLLPQLMSSSIGASMMVQVGKAPEQIGRMASTSLWFIFMVSVPACFGIAAVAEPAVRVLYGPEYLAAIPVFALVGLFGVARSLSYPVLEVLFMRDNQNFVVAWSCFMVLVNVGLAVWWIPEGAAIGAAFVKGAVQFLSLAGLWVYAAHAVGLHLPLGRALRVVLASSVMAAAVYAVTKLVPPALGLAFGIPAGILVLAVGLRLTRTLDVADATRLAALERLVPWRLRGSYLGLLRLVVPAFTP